MDIQYHPEFRRRLSQLSRYDRELVLSAIEFFREDRHHADLRNHALLGAQTGMRSISADDDLRLIFTQKNDYKNITFFSVGRHKDIYKK